MPLQAVLFDLDDTLHDKSATLSCVGARQFEANEVSSLGVQRESWLTRYLALNNQRIEKTQVFCMLGAEFGLSSALAKRLLEEFDAQLGSEAVAYPGALELLVWCRQKNLRTGIVTNGRDAFQRSKVAGMGIEHLVDTVFTSGGFGSKKPDLSIFNACLAALQVNAEDAAFVGDDFHADMEPSRQLGMRTVWKSPASSSAVSFCSDSLFEIRAYLHGEA